MLRGDGPACQARCADRNIWRSGVSYPLSKRRCDLLHNRFGAPSWAAPTNLWTENSPNSDITVSCEHLHMSPPSRIISRQAFASANQAYFAPAALATSSAARRGASPRPANGSHLGAAASASAEELIAAIGLEPGYAHVRRHLELLQDLSRSWINSSQIALLAFPGAVPKLVVDKVTPVTKRLDSMVRRIAPVWGST
jgi:hypothetical protein